MVQSVGPTIAEILDRPPIAMVKKFVEPVRLELFLAAELNKLRYSVNIDDRLNLQKEQIPAIAEQLLAMYPIESLEDFVLCFRRGAMGFYGSIYRLDAAVIQEWFSKYLDEKYQLIESGWKKQKDEELQQDSVLDYEAFKKRVPDLIKKQRVTNENENEYQRFRLAYLEERKQKIENEISQPTGTQTETETAE